VNELLVRSLSAIAMILIAVAAAFQGGYYFAVLVAAASFALNSPLPAPEAALEHAFA
jgi:hypothetical protein